jgi:hypothetical protein
MATRSEQFKAEAERKHPSSAHVAGETKPTAPHGHAEKKAAYAREAQPADAQPSRKSTRKSANRAKPDTTLQHSVQMKENTPESRHERSHDTGTRGGGAP